MITFRPQGREEERHKRAALPYSVTRAAWRRPPIPRSSGAAEVEDPPGTPTTQLLGGGGGENISAGLRLSRADFRWSGEKRDNGQEDEPT